MSTERRVDHADGVEVTEGEPAWDNPTVWLSQRWEPKAGTPGKHQVDLESAARQSLADNRAYIAAPTAGTTAGRLTALEAQAKAAARQRNGIIRVLLAEFAGTD